MAVFYRQANGDYVNPNPTPGFQSVIHAADIKSVDGNRITLKSDSGPDGHPVIDTETGQMSFSGQPGWHKALMAAPLAVLGAAALPAILGGGGAAEGATQAAVNGTAAASEGGAAAAGGAGAAAAGGAAGAAPTGGFGSFATGVARALTALNSGQAAGRVAEAQANVQQHDELLRQMAMELAKNTDQTQTTGVDYNRQVRGGILQGLSDVNVTPPPDVHMGTITGGLRPSAIVGAKDIGSNMQRNATMDLLGQGNPTQGGLTGLNSITTPTLPPLPSPNGAQNALGYAAPALGLTSSMWNFLKGRAA